MNLPKHRTLAVPRWVNQPWVLAIVTLVASACGGNTAILGELNGGGGVSTIGGSTGVALTNGDTGGNSVAGVTQSSGGRPGTGGTQTTSAAGSGGLSTGTGLSGTGGASAFGGSSALGSSVAFGGAGGNVSSLATGGAFVPASTSITVDASGLLNPSPASSLVVAPDERHVAFVTDPLPDSYYYNRCPEQSGEWLTVRSQSVGTLVVVTLNDDGTATSRAIARPVRHGDYAFSADSHTLVYEDNYDACPYTSRLNIAAADGTGAQVLIASGTDQVIAIIGNALYYLAPVGNASTTYAMLLPTSDPLLTPVPMYQGLAPSPDGETAASCNADNDLVLQDVATHSEHVVSGNGDYCNRIIWSGDSAYLSFETASNGLARHLVAVAKDGTERKEFDTAGLLESSSWAPNDHRLLYDAPDGQGGSRLAIHSFDDGSDVSITGGPDPTLYYAWAEFSGDGSTVVLSYIKQIDSGAQLLSAASTQSNGSLRYIAPALQHALSYRGDYVAVSDTYGNTKVFPTAGGAPVTMPSSITPAYEPAAPTSRLLLHQYGQATTNAFYLAAANGSSLLLINDPNDIAGPQWIGHHVVYYTYDSVSFTSYRAVNGNGPGSTMLAMLPDTFVYAPITLPTRVFYSRLADKAGAPAGLYYSDLPK